jgi:aspartyl-tRNA(Asn)/glutamyl-tRNA(Gln) amidotransferase subunit A
MSSDDGWHNTADILESRSVRELNAIVAYQRDTVKTQALAGAIGPSYAIKDNICTLEYPTTCASESLRDFRSPYEATAIARIKGAGGIIACKANLDEFAMGSSTEYSMFGRTLNPLDRDRVPGGSSGGSAALVAAGAVDVALGSDTGGSVRQPAAFCGVVGIKPTYGRVSRFGLVAFGSSLDQIGVLARDTKTAAATLATVSGRDPSDPTCADRDPLGLEPEIPDLSGMTVGIPQEYFPRDLDKDVRLACDRAIAVMRSSGITVRDVSLPHTHYAVPAYYIIASAEASSNLSRYDGMRYGSRSSTEEGGDIVAMYRATRGAGFGPEVLRRILVGTFVLSAGYHEAYYGKAQCARSRIAEDFTEVFSSGVDLLFTPTTPTTAFGAGEKALDPVAMYQSDVFVCPANLARVPAMSLPIGRANGLPVGGQLIGPMFGEAKMLGAAGTLETLLDGDREI